VKGPGKEKLRIEKKEYDPNYGTARAGGLDGKKVKSLTGGSVTNQFQKIGRGDGGKGARKDARGEVKTASGGK